MLHAFCDIVTNFELPTVYACTHDVSFCLCRFQALQSSTASGNIASHAEASTSPDSDAAEQNDDMEFARRLQEEEDRIHYERMLQMAGIGNHFLRVTV